MKTKIAASAAFLAVLAVVGATAPGAAQTAAPGATAPASVPGTTGQAAVTSGAALPAAAANQTAGKAATPVDRATRKFVTKAAQGGLAEVQLGRLAQAHAENADVKAFGQKMVDDHSNAGEQLAQVAAAKNVTLPSEPDSTAKHEYKKLSALSGPKFDRAYISYMVKDHKEDVADYAKYASRGSDAEVKAFAAKTLPTLRDHLDSAKKAEQEVH